MSYLYISTIVSTIIIRMSSSNWLIIWAIIEINLIVFIPFICTKKYLIDISPSIKYFLAQVIGSIILIFFLLFLLVKRAFSIFYRISSFFLLLSIAIKSGTPPFHFWFPQLIEISNWVRIIALLTLQKVIPLMFLFYSISPFFIILTIRRGLIGSIGGFNQNSVKKIFAYSSITHMGWVMLSMIYSVKSRILYFFIYSFLVASTLFIIKYSRMEVNSTSSNNFTSNRLNYLVFFMLLSISGVPPFRGFFIKLIVIKRIRGGLILAILIVLFSLVSIIFYLRVMYSYFIDLSSCIKVKSIFRLFPIKLFTFIILLNLFLPVLLSYLT